MIAARPLLVLLCALLLLQDCRTDQKVVAFYENERWGFKDATGKVIIPPVYKSYNTTSDPAFIAVKGDSLWGVINSSGDTLIPFQYTTVSDEIHDGMVHVSRGEKYGYITQKGEVVLPLIYDSQFYFSGNIATVQRDGKYGMINKKGETVIPFEYQELHSRFRNGLAGARKNNKWGFIDSTNHMIVPFIYSEVEPFHEGLARVADAKDKYGFINAKNDTVIPLVYDMPQYCFWIMEGFKNGMALVTQNGKSGYIGSDGKNIIPLKYHCIWNFCDGFAAIIIANDELFYSSKLKKNSFGYVDSKGNEFIIPYAEYYTFDWGITAAPALLPDMTDTLGYFIPKEPDLFMGGVIAPPPFDGVYIADTVRTPPEPEKPVLPQKRWTMEKMLNHSINAFIQEPQIYPDLCKLKEVSIAHGLLIGRGNFSEDFMYPNTSGWEFFKKETIYKIIGTENLREAAWKWMAPYYKKAMQQMHPFHKQTYKDIAVYMKNYMNTWNRRQTENYLKRDEARFAHYDRHGKYDPYRKLSAFVDRLIIMHNVIDEDDARKWINHIADDVAAW